MKEMNDFQKYIHLSRYSRYLEEEGRRETWEETVNRYVSYITDRVGVVPEGTVAQLRLAIIDMEVMPSMRAMMSAGKALERDNVSGFNCAYVALDHQRAFDEIMYILMCGTGVGFSVERQYIRKLPEVPEQLVRTDDCLRVRDSKIGWAEGFRQLLRDLYEGVVPRWDLSRIRAAGARLKTFGGRSSGPQPLENLFKFTVELFRNAGGRQLTSIECHDLVCKVADIVVVGGVRRSALISLSNLSDDRMRRAKRGQFGVEHPQRYLANNSAVYDGLPDFPIFLKEWSNLYESKSGERGIFSRSASRNQAAKNGRRDSDSEFGTNPCSEIILRSCQVCNLSEVVVRSTDTLEDLERKVRLATILGTLQSSLTNFRYLRKCWRDNTEEEALLGVSLTGIMDHTGLSDSYTNGTGHLKEMLQRLKQVAIDTNKEWAKKLGVNQSVAVTCVKPSGTVSQLVNSSSGIHPRFAPYYIRRVIGDVKDPLTSFMIEEGVPHERSNTKPDSQIIFSFPCKAPIDSICVQHVQAIDQLDIWQIYQQYWCEHKPSCTVYYKDDEFLEVGSWIYKNLEEVSGLSFFPKNDHIYDQAPYEEITEEEYNEAVALMPHIYWERFKEEEDNTTSSQEYACSGGQCEL